MDTGTFKKPGVILREVIDKVKPDLKSISEVDSGSKPSPGKWSQKEILGHLIDSAIVNQQRFVRALLSEDLVFKGYEQDVWVKMQRYNEGEWSELVDLWYSLNRNISRLMNTASEEVLFIKRHNHNLNEIAWKPVSADQPSTLDYFMRDYTGHLEYHLDQLFNLKTDQR